MINKSGVISTNDYDGLKIKNISFLMNNSSKLSKSEVYQMHSIKMIWLNLLKELENF